MFITGKKNHDHVKVFNFFLYYVFMFITGKNHDHVKVKVITLPKVCRNISTVL